MDIVLESSDTKIWNIEEVIIQLSKLMSDRENITINTNNEGLCCTQSGIYNLLDKLCFEFSYPKNQITIITPNPLEYHKEYQIDCNRHHFFKKTVENINITAYKDFSDSFKHFGIFIGRQNWQRLWIASQCDKLYKDKTLMSYHFSMDNDFHKLNADFDNLINFTDLNTVLQSVMFLKNTPKFARESDLLKGRIPMETTYKIADLYHNFFLEVVCETYFSGNTFFPTEKTLRPIRMKTPFIVQGPRGFLDNMKKHGFKTFDKWWSEIYQDFNKLPKDNELQWSTIEIFKLLESISNYSVKDLKEIYNDMKPVIEHNYKILEMLR